MKKILLISLIFSFLSLNSQNFDGSWGYRISDHYITLYGDKIENQNNGGRTGTLKVAIYATN